MTVAFPEIAEALERQAATSFVIDGEVVAFEGGRTVVRPTAAAHPSLER